MKKILNNGLTIVCKDVNKFEEVSLTFKSGHINEPLVGIAGVYEKIVASNSKLGSIVGGSMTSFVLRNTDGVNTINKAIKALFKGCVKIPVTQISLASAVEDIVKHTEDLAPLPERQVKLAYKHTAFGNSTLWQTDEYLEKLEELTTKDVTKYIEDNFVGGNIVISYCGPKDDIDEVADVVEKYFGKLPAGNKNADCNLSYTGGFQFIQGEGNSRIARFGWYLPKEYNTAETNILMSMLAGRLERSTAEAKIEADTTVKIAGYFGLRTLCITLKCFGKRNFDTAVNIVLENIKRLQTSEASDRRMETTRSRAAIERLCISNEALPRSVEAAWSLLGRNIDYDVDSIISNLYNVTAHDVKIVAREIFSQKPTVVFYTRKPHITFDKIVKTIAYVDEDGSAAKSQEATASNDVDDLDLTDTEKAAIERIDACNPA